MPLLFKIDPEVVHQLTLKLVDLKLFPKPKIVTSDILKSTLLDSFTLDNPIGLAAGCDKNGLAIDGFFKMGFGMVEIGSITPLPQEGNPKPRIFRLSKDHAVINRLGFNNDGFDNVYKRIEKFRQKKSQRPEYYKNRKLGVNVGRNKNSTDLFDDYVKGLKRFHDVADYLVINISSPNTPGLRDMQKQEFLEPLLSKLNEIKKEIIAHGPSTTKFPLLFLKISPDMSDEENRLVAKSILDWKKKKCLDGIIISNTTISRPSSLTSAPALLEQTGGLSGEPLRNLSTRLISQYYKLTNGEIPIIGIGGVSDGKDAYEKIRAGASLIQLYTALMYQGPPLVSKINLELEQLLRKDGFKNVSEAVGAGNG